MNTPLASLPIILPMIAAPILYMFNRRLMFQRVVSLGTATTVALITGWLFIQVQNSGMVTYDLGGWQAPFGIVIAADMLSMVFLGMAAFLAPLVIFYSFWAIPDRGERYSYYPLLMLLLASINGMCLTGDLFNFFVFLEMMLISSFALIALEGNRRELEASFKYAVLNLLASSLLVIAVAGIYGVTGTLNMADLAQKIAGTNIPQLIPIMMLFVAAFGVKAALFPFHFWLPDAHSMAPTPISALLSGVIVKIGVYGFLRLFYTVFGGLALGDTLMWLASISVIFGMICAVTQQDIKRLLAYSTISQVGYILLAVSLGSLAGLTSAIIYTINHMIIKAGLFFLAGTIIKQTGTKVIGEMGGLLKQLPMTAVLFLIGSLALAGVPPLNGFMSKLSLVVAILDTERYVLLAPVIIGTMLTLVVMTRVWMQIFLGSSGGKIVNLSRPALAPALVLTVAIFGFGLIAQPIFTIAGEVADQLIEPGIYISNVMAGVNR